jgi:hypothetical protein
MATCIHFFNVMKVNFLFCVGNAATTFQNQIGFTILFSKVTKQINLLLLVLADVIT